MRAIDSKAFGRRVRERREELGLSQPELGCLAGYSQQNIGHIEAGKLKKPERAASALARALQTTDIWLLWEDGPPPPQPKFFSPKILVERYSELDDADKEEVSRLVTKRRKPPRKRKSA